MSCPRARSFRFPLPAVTLVALLAAGAVPASGIDFGVRAGGYLEDQDPFVGLELLARMGSSDWFFNPNVEVVLGGERDRVAASFDFHYDFRQTPEYSLWAGLGPAVIFTEGTRGQDDETDFGVDLLGGIGWNLSGMTPYAQLKLVLSDEAEIVAGVGIRF